MGGKSTVRAKDMVVGVVIVVGDDSLAMKTWFHGSINAEGLAVAAKVPLCRAHVHRRWGPKHVVLFAESNESDGGWV